MPFLPTPLIGNVIEPSIVNMICAPVPVPFGHAFTLVITVPTLLVITTIEAIVVNHLSKVKRFWRLFRWLFLANAISSFFGVFVDMRAPGSIYPAWRGFMIAYLLSAVAESPLLWVPLRRNGFTFPTALRFSFLANAASYAFLAVLVLGLTAIPMYQTDPTHLRGDLLGQILVYQYRNTLTVVQRIPVDPSDKDRRG